MKQINITTAFLAAISLLVPACDKAQTSSTIPQPEDRVKALEAEIDRLKAAKPATAKPNGELTRELAAELLNKHLARPSVSIIQFNKTGFEQAMQDGIVGPIPNYNFHDLFRFTDKGLMMVGSLDGDENFIRRNSSDAFWWFRLKNPIKSRVQEITGIAAERMPDFFSVEYITNYLLPQAMQPMERYIFLGSTAESKFRKYDDGWRVSE